MEEVYEEPKLYTVFNLGSVQEAMSYTDREDNPITFEFMEMPHNPRISLDGTQGICTGIFGEAPDCCHLTQEEAEALMSSDSWTNLTGE